MFDPSAIAARELLSLFGKNTAVRVDHKYGHNTLDIVVARTGNVIATITVSDQGKRGNIYSVSNVTTPSLEEVSRVIMGQKRFPRPRNMKRAWSPIRITQAAREELDIRRATMNGYFI